MLDKKLDGRADVEDLNAAILHRRLTEISSEVPADTAGRVEAKTKPWLKGVTSLSLVGAGGVVWAIVENAPKAAKALHAMWVGAGAAGADLIK